MGWWRLPRRTSHERVEPGPDGKLRCSWGTERSRVRLILH